MKRVVFLVVLTVVCLGIAAQADVTVTNLSFPDWQQISNNTFALPASSANCGVENELACEPVGVFKFSVGFTSGTGTYNIADTDTADGSLALSDQIQVVNGTDGFGYVYFYSDPNLNGLNWDGSYLCNENTGNGCIGTISAVGSDGTVLTINVASDSEAVFDPFGFGADTSDQIQVLGATHVGAPEPGSLVLLGSGLIGLAGTIRRKLKV